MLDETDKIEISNSGLIDEVNTLNNVLTDEFILCKNLLIDFCEKSNDSKKNIQELDDEIKKLSKLIKVLRAEYTKTDGEIFTLGLMHINIIKKITKLNRRFRNEKPFIRFEGKRVLNNEKNYKDFDAELASKVSGIYIKKQLLETKCNDLQIGCDNAFKLRNLLKRRLEIEIDRNANAHSSIGELKVQMQKIDNQKIQFWSCLEIADKPKQMVKQK